MKKAVAKYVFGMIGYGCSQAQYFGDILGCPICGASMA
jgi:hypothetical protein